MQRMGVSLYKYRIDAREKPGKPGEGDSVYSGVEDRWQLNHAPLTCRCVREGIRGFDRRMAGAQAACRPAEGDDAGEGKQTRASETTGIWTAIVSRTRHGGHQPGKMRGGSNGRDQPAGGGRGTRIRGVVREEDVASETTLQLTF